MFWGAAADDDNIGVMAKGSEETAQKTPPRLAVLPVGGDAAAAPEAVPATAPAPPPALRQRPAEDVRLDKWLQVARVYKTRALASKACELGRVEVNGQPAKAHRHLKVGDKVETTVSGWKRELWVKVLVDKPVAKAEALLLFDDRSGPRPEMDPMERLMRRTPAVRDKGAGRPTKRDRREIDRLDRDRSGGDE